MKPRRFVIPDIHGCALTFRCLLEDVIRLEQSDAIYLLGDTIDRGPRSREVLDTIRRLQVNGYDIQSLRGNHEDMFLKSCRDRTNFYLWIQNGGRETLKSFGVEDSCEIPRLFRHLMENFPFFIELEEYILVHGGLNFTISDPFTDKEAMIWSRNTQVFKGLIGGRKLVSGHTTLIWKEIERSLTTDHIMLDNGCVYKGESGMGNLTALELNSMTLLFQENIDF
jgi:serine/threonine protein phosphatase 1